MLVAVCDEEILGKTFKEGNLILDVNENFYKGELLPINEAINIVKKATIANLVGKNIVSKAIEEGLIHPEAVLRIKSIPHAQIVKMF